MRTSRSGHSAPQNLREWWARISKPLSMHVVQGCSCPTCRGTRGCWRLSPSCSGAGCSKRQLHLLHSRPEALDVVDPTRQGRKRSGAAAQVGCGVRHTTAGALPRLLRLPLPSSSGCHRGGRGLLAQQRRCRRHRCPGWRRRWRMPTHTSQVAQAAAAEHVRRSWKQEAQHIRQAVEVLAAVAAEAKRAGGERIS